MSSFFILGFFGMVEAIFTYIGDIITGLINFLLFSPLTLIFIGISLIAAFAEMVFKKVAGLDVIYVGGEEFAGASKDGNGQDLVYAFITDPAVQNVFWAIVGLSLVLLFIFTIIALIRSEFALDLKGNAKAPIIGRALKSFANFIIVPVVSLISILGVNFLTRSIYELFDSTTGSSIVAKCFYVGAYNANRARISRDFAKQLSEGEAYADGSPNPFDGMDQREVAFAIDQYFINSETDTGVQHKTKSLWDQLCDGDIDATNDGYINFSLIFFGYPSSDDFSYLNLRQINFYYDLTQFDFILAIGSAICMCWILLTSCLALIKRVFELTILFLLAPAMTAIAPLDGGQAEKKWRQEFMKRLLAVVGPVFAFNMYFLLVPIFSSITLFGTGSFTDSLFVNPTLASSGSLLGSLIVILASFVVLFDILFQIICIIVGMSIVKSASALLCNLLGVEDLVKAGDEMGKKAIKTGASAVGAAASLAIPAVKGAAVAMKAMKGAKKAKNFAKGNKDMLADQSQVADAKKDVETGEAAVDAQQKVVDDKTKALQDYNEANDVEGARKRAADAKSKGGRAFAQYKNSSQGLKDAKAIKESDRLDAERKAEVEKKDKAQEALDASRATLSKREAGFSQEAEDKLASLRSTEGKSQADIEKDAKAADALEANIKNANISNGKKGLRRYLAHEKFESEQEFGSGQKETSMFAKTFSNEDNFFGKTVKFLDKFNLGGTALKEQMETMFLADPSKGGFQRRFNDKFADLLGDKGDLHKMFYNKNARAGIFENTPESKTRNEKIQQDLSWGARQAWQDKYDLDKARKAEEKTIRRMLAEKSGDATYIRKIEERDRTTEKARIDKIDAEIDKLEIKNGYKAAAAAYYDDLARGDKAKHREMSEYKQKLENAAAQEALTKQNSKMGTLQAVAGQNGGKLEVKQDDSSIEKMQRAFERALERVNGKKGAATVNVEAILKGLNSLKELEGIIETLKTAVNKLPSDPNNPNS